MQKARTLVVVILFAVIFVGGLFLGFKFPAWFGSGGGLKIHNTATLLRQVQSLSQLVTVKYVVEKVVLLEDVKWYGDNRVLLLAHGVVKAGVDFSQLQPGDLEVSGRRVTVRLSPAQITDVYLDEAETQVVERETGILRAFDKNLEQVARQTALDDIRRAARRSGILKDAEDRARDQLTGLFRQLGFEDIEVVGSVVKP